MSTETTWSLITFLAAALVGLAVYAVQERMERIVAEDKASHWLAEFHRVNREADRHSRSLAVAHADKARLNVQTNEAVEARARAESEAAHAIARADSTGASWADAIAQPGHLPTVRGPKDRTWVAAGDEPVLDQVRASHGLPTHQTVVKFPSNGRGA